MVLIRTRLNNHLQSRKQRALCSRLLLGPKWPGRSNESHVFARCIQFLHSGTTSSFACTMKKSLKETTREFKQSSGLMENPQKTLREEYSETDVYRLPNPWWQLGIFVLRSKLVFTTSIHHFYLLLCPRMRREDIIIPKDFTHSSPLSKMLGKHYSTVFRSWMSFCIQRTF